MLQRTGNQKVDNLVKKVEKNGNGKTKEKHAKVFEENDIIIYFGKITLEVAWRET